MATEKTETKTVLDAITHAFDVVAIAWGEDCVEAKLLSEAMRRAAEVTVREVASS